METEKIIIDVPKGHTYEQTTSGNTVNITFKKKDSEWEEYVKQYARNWSPYGLKLDNYDPQKWTVEFKFGLLKWISDNIDGGEKQKNYLLYSGAKKT